MMTSVLRIDVSEVVYDTELEIIHWPKAGIQAVQEPFCPLKALYCAERKFIASWTCKISTRTKVEIKSCLM
jgi:hypothetical protein